MFGVVSNTICENSCCKIFDGRELFYKKSSLISYHINFSHVCIFPMRSFHRKIIFCYNKTLAIEFSMMDRNLFYLMKDFFDILANTFDKIVQNFLVKYFFNCYAIISIILKLLNQHVFIKNYSSSIVA